MVASSDPLAAIEGNVADRSHGNDTLSLTTAPLTSTATSRTCTSSVISACRVTVEPSTTWMPGVFGSLSAGPCVMVTVGGTPWVSNER